MEYITDPKNKSLSIFPIKHHVIYNHYQSQISAFWKPEEIEFAKDKYDYEILTKDEQHVIKTILAFFASSDGIVNINIQKNLIDKITIPEIILTYQFQVMMENVHNLTYGMMLETMISDTVEKNKLFNAINEVETIKIISKWATDWIDSDKPLSYKILVFMLVEGLLFSGVFAVIFWFKDKYKGLLQGFVKANEFIARDEAAHYIFGKMIFEMIEHKPSKEEIKNIILEGVDMAYKLTDEALQVKHLGLNNNLLRQYIENVADRIAIDTINEKIFNSENPFSFMNIIGLTFKQNFFEGRPTEYQSANVAGNDFNITDCDDDF